jgi:hypothetical protein
MITEAELELTKQVAKLFKANYTRGPWPNEMQCYPVAVAINVIRNNEQYREEFAEENVSLRERKTVVEAIGRLINNQKRILNTQLEQFKPLRLSNWVEDLASLDALEITLKAAVPALLQPFDPLAGERDMAWWHKAARLIAEKAQVALKEAGHKKVSSQKHGPFVRVVADALRLATGQDFEPGTVASVLAKTPQ